MRENELTRPRSVGGTMVCLMVAPGAFALTSPMPSTTLPTSAVPAAGASATSASPSPSSASATAIDKPIRSNVSIPITTPPTMMPAPIAASKRPSAVAGA